MDGWFGEEGSNQPSCSSASPRLGLFDMHSGSFCRVETGCVPGLGGMDCSDVESQVLSSTSTTPQRQFFQISTHMGTSVFAEKSLRQSPLEEFFYADQNYPASASSSSLRSLSVGSPECSSLIMSKPNCASHLPEANLREASMEQATHQRRSSPLVPPQQVITMQACGHIRNAQFPMSIGDDEALARAMLAVISSSSPSSSIHPPMQRQERHRGGAFGPYDPSLVPCRTEGKQVAQGQQMIKRGFSMLRRIRDQMSAEEQMPEARPTSNQLHHMISERKRREKLNESFDALRALLPPGTKRDKASVLASTIDSLNILRTQIDSLEEKNRVMEARLLLPCETDHEVEGDESGDAKRVTTSVQILRAPKSSTDGQQQIELRVTVRVECDMIDLVLHMLECLKEMRGIEVVSLDGTIIRAPHMMNPVRRAIITIQIKGDDYWDEGSFREAITAAVDEALAVPSRTAAP